jgi:hypothetical protein
MVPSLHHHYIRVKSSRLHFINFHHHLLGAPSHQLQPKHVRLWPTLAQVVYISIFSSFCSATEDDNELMSVIFFFFFFNNKRQWQACTRRKRWQWAFAHRRLVLFLVT